jgi:hypothetical protein
VLAYALDLLRDALDVGLVHGQIGRIDELLRRAHLGAPVQAAGADERFRRPCLRSGTLVGEADPGQHWRIARLLELGAQAGVETSPRLGVAGDRDAHEAEKARGEAPLRQVLHVSKVRSSGVIADIQF